MSTPSSRNAWFVLAAAFLGWMFDGVEMGIFPLVARSALHEMQTATGVVDDKFVGLWMGRITAFFLIGGAIGFAMRLVFAAVEMAGDIAGTQMGLGFALFYDPGNVQHTPLLGQFMGLVATLTFL